MMNSQSSFATCMLFQSMNEDLNASLATADSLSREFNSLLQECSPSQNSSSSLSMLRSEEKPQKVQESSYSTGRGNGSSSPQDQYRVVSRSSDPSKYTGDLSTQYGGSSSSRINATPTWGGSGQLTPPTQSPGPQRRLSPTRSPTYNDSQGSLPRGSSVYADWNLPPGPKVTTGDPRNMFQPTVNSPFDSSRRRDRSPSPRPFGQPSSSNLPRGFMPLRSADEVTPRQKTPAHWNETDLDGPYERKPHHTYDKSEWLRPSVPNSSWRESNLDASPPASKKLQPSYSSLPRGVRLTPERPSPLLGPHGSSPYNPQPIISRISIPPVGTQPRRSRPIPLSVIMRLQNPRYNMGYARSPRGPQGEEEGGGGLYQPQLPLPHEYLPQLAPHRERQSEVYGEVLSSGDVDAELERLDLGQGQEAPNSSVSETGEEKRTEGEPEAVPRPLSPTRLQPVVAPEAAEVPDRQEILRLRAEIPRALKRRGSTDQALPLEKAQILPANQYRHMINKLLRRKDDRKGEQESESSSSSEAEESSSLPTDAVAPSTPLRDLPEQKGLNSILRRSSRERKNGGRRARLSPLVLLLDGSLVGELETVQRAVQEMSDVSQPNDEGITALHNAICGGHYAVVDFLVRIGANVSAPDSHGWTPLHCAASCNDLPLCEYLVRSGAAVMAVTESDGATASQKCDPFAPGFEECESFLRGVEEAMGVENSGVLYALWGYTAQAPDELTFREGDMVTILQKPERGEWWWSSLCGREGFVPNNYFGLFPKVRPKSLC